LTPVPAALPRKSGLQVCKDSPAELKRADVTYEELARRLRGMGLEETKVSIASKLSRGGFGATFFIATMKAIGRETVNLGDL